MKKIDEARLENDLQYRFGYLAEFIGFGADDIKVITGAAPLLAPLVPGLVDAVYVKLFSYECTKRHFVPKQSGYEGAVPETIDALSQDHEMIKFRKGHLAKYLETLVTGAYDAKMVEYLDLVGKMHTPKAGSKLLDVPLVQMNALMGFVADAVNATIFGFKLDCETTQAAIRSFSKLLWIQNDLITRHYQGVKTNA
ncbi:MAG: protoglobin family protein [Cyanobacteria bacterium]|nr:protoglobin family protein [Cyanobacteriota bacterium]